MKKKDFSIIVAIDANRGIGKDGRMPWHLPSDMRYFKEVTLKTASRLKSNAVIMGRKTWESIPEKFRPLAERVNIVLTRNPLYDFPASVVKAQNLEEAFFYINGHAEEIENVFVIGGAQIYQKAVGLPECRYLYVTEIFKAFECDAFFPEFEKAFERVWSSEYSEENTMTYHFARYQRRSIPGKL